MKPRESDKDLLDSDDAIVSDEEIEDVKNDFRMSRDEIIDADTYTMLGIYRGMR